MSAARPPKWGEVKALFQQAIDLPPEERSAFLSRACGGGGELHAELESLLASHEDERPFLDAPPIARARHVLAAGEDDREQSAAELSPGDRIGQYELLERLGAGGMGQVFRARDTTLDRVVALKTVQDSAAAFCTHDHILREARAASALTHPNICTIYEVGEFDGRPYLAMEYVAGQSLDGLLRPHGLPTADLVAYGLQIADALAHAHEHGVIHRDLKTANVVVTPQGRAKMLDFGIATRVTVVTAAPRSSMHPEPIAGTPAYMAPELLRGQAADARSDIWALGVLLYEMACGSRPFPSVLCEGAPAVETDAPLPLPSTVPRRLADVISRCLARDPRDRFQSAKEVSAALETAGAVARGSFGWTATSRRTLWGSAAAALLVTAYVAPQWRTGASDAVPAGTSVAVLPFRVAAGAEEIGFLGIGLPDSIVGRLSLVSGLHVRPTSAVVVWDKEPVDHQHAGRALSVEYVLTGTIDAGGEQIRVTPRLLRVADGVPLWTRAYALSSANLLGVQDQIAGGVVEALEIEMTGADRARVYRRHTGDPEAYKLYLRGRSQLVRSQPASAVAAFESFQAALRRHQDYALAHAGAAAASAQMKLFFATEADVGVWETRAHEAARRALQLDPTLAEAHEALAAVYRHAEFDWHQAIEESDRALALNANLDQPHLYRASAFSHLGLLDRVAPEADAARAINPANVSEPLRVQGVTAMFEGRFAEAAALLEKARSTSGKLSAEWNLAHAYYYAGRQKEAEAMLGELRGSARSERRAQATLASFVAARGDTARSRELIAIVTSASYMDHHVAYALGAAYAQLGEHSEAIRWLTQARSTGLPCYPWFDRDPLLEPLRATAAFRQLLEELKRSWQTAAARHRGR